MFDTYVRVRETLHCIFKKGTNLTWFWHSVYIPVLGGGGLKSDSQATLKDPRHDLIRGLRLRDVIFVRLFASLAPSLNESSINDLQFVCFC